MSTASLTLPVETDAALPEKRRGLIVVGGGITGLSAALAWARHVDVREEPVTVLEKQPVVGGYVTSFRRKGYLFDIAQLAPDLSDILEYFGVDIELKRFEGCCARILLADPETGKSREIRIPAGMREFRCMLRERYPREAANLDAFFEYSRAMYEELHHLRVEPNPLQLIRTAITCPKIARNRACTFREYFNRFGFTDPELREIFEVFAAFSGLPGGRAAALFTVSALNATLDRACRPKKGFIELPLKLRRRLQELGGVVRTRTEVERILIEDGRATGVRLADGEIIESEYVITTIDPTVAMGKLVGYGELRALDPEYADKVESVRMSASSLHISLGLDEGIDLAGRGLDCGYTVITTGGESFEQLFRAFDRGETGFSENCFHIEAICPSLITGGRPSLIIRAVPSPMADWAELRREDREAYRRRKEKWADFFICQVEKYLLPGLREHIVVKDIATPATFARFSGSPTGANYDMAPYPDNFGRTRLRMRTPVKGLFQPKFSHGIRPAFLGGMQAVDMILGGKVMGGYARMKRK